jgi:hypothetical protein
VAWTLGQNGRDRLLGCPNLQGSFRNTGRAQRTGTATILLRARSEPTDAATSGSVRNGCCLTKLSRHVCGLHWRSASG